MKNLYHSLEFFFELTENFNEVYVIIYTTNNGFYPAGGFCF